MRRAAAAGRRGGRAARLGAGACVGGGGPALPSGRAAVPGASGGFDSTLAVLGRGSADGAGWPAARGGAAPRDAAECATGPAHRPDGGFGDPARCSRGGGLCRSGQEGQTGGPKSRGLILVATSPGQVAPCWIKAPRFSVTPTGSGFRQQWAMARQATTAQANRERIAEQWAMARRVTTVHETWPRAPPTPLLLSSIRVWAHSGGRLPAWGTQRLSGRPGCWPRSGTARRRRSPR